MKRIKQVDAGKKTREQENIKKSGSLASLQRSILKWVLERESNFLSLRTAKRGIRSQDFGPVFGKEIICCDITSAKRPISTQSVRRKRLLITAQTARVSIYHQRIQSPYGAAYIPPIHRPALVSPPEPAFTVRELSFPKVLSHCWLLYRLQIRSRLL